MTYLRFDVRVADFISNHRTLFTVCAASGHSNPLASLKTAYFLVKKRTDFKEILG